MLRTAASAAARARTSAPSRTLFAATRPVYNEGERPPSVTRVSRGDTEIKSDAASRK